MLRVSSDLQDTVPLEDSHLTTAPGPYHTINPAVVSIQLDMRHV